MNFFIALQCYCNHNKNQTLRSGFCVMLCNVLDYFVAVLGIVTTASPVDDTTQAFSLSDHSRPVVP